MSPSIPFPGALRPRLAAALFAVVAFGGPLSVPAQPPVAAGDRELAASAAGAFYQRELARAKAAHTLDWDRQLLARARKVGSRLLAPAKAADAGATPWSFALSVETRREPIAWCLPNGQMLITTGLVQGLALNDAELGAVIAHVMAHAVRGDELRAAMALYRRSRPDPDPDTNRATEELADILSGIVLEPHADAAAEIAADALALEMTARAAIDPAAAVSAWRKISQSSATAPPAIRAMHPVPPERLKAIEARAAEVRPLYEAAREALAAAPKPPPATMQSNPSYIPPRDPRDKRAPSAPPARQGGASAGS